MILILMNTNVNNANKYRQPAGQAAGRPGRQPVPIANSRRVFEVRSPQILGMGRAFMIMMIVTIIGVINSITDISISIISISISIPGQLFNVSPPLRILTRLSTAFASFALGRVRHPTTRRRTRSNTSLVVRGERAREQ